MHWVQSSVDKLCRIQGGDTGGCLKVVHENHLKH
jgi:hypothetical protein